ncbi:helix-turn-helix domain-containing protein [Micromonospora craniellae]|nr:helix-turn-helix domain-containing protein [Micromonospora craniellae]
MTMPDHHAADYSNLECEQPDDTAWTVERIRALGPWTDIATVAEIFGLSRATAYELAKRGQFPIAVLRFGSRYRVPVAAILAALHLPVGDEHPPPPAT